MATAESLAWHSLLGEPDGYHPERSVPNGQGHAPLGTTSSTRPVSRLCSLGCWTTPPTTLPEASEHFDAARADILASIQFPTGVWQQVWSNNLTGWLNRKIRRRTDSVGIFPNRDAIVRFISAVLTEQTDEWAEECRYLGLEIPAKSRLSPTANRYEHEETQMPALTN